MLGKKTRVAILALAIVPLSATQARAFCCHRWFGAPAPTVVNYAPAPTVVNYVPQTSYRTVYYNAPVTTYSPMTACNACGGATTVMRPVTTYVTQARLVPYTTYRPVVMAAPVAVAPMAATAYYAPVAPAAPACCAAGYAPAPVSAGYAPAPVSAGYAPAGYAPAPVTAGYAAPQVTAGYGQAPATYYGAPPMNAPAALGAPGTTVQSLSPTPASPTSNPGYPSPGPAPAAAPADQTQPPTFGNPPDNGPSATQSRIVLPPRSTPSSTSGTPRALDPEDALDQSTALPLRRSVAMRPVSTSNLDRPLATSADDGGWRSARP
jgi:hypothetical protein